MPHLFDIQTRCLCDSISLCIITCSLPSHPPSHPPILSLPNQIKSLRGVLFTCAYLAAKVYDRLEPGSEQLRFMLTRLHGSDLGWQEVVGVSRV